MNRDIIIGNNLNPEDSTSVIHSHVYLPSRGGVHKSKEKLR